MSSFPFGRWPDFDRIFERALDLEGGQRASFLDRACTDPEMRREVDALLAADHPSQLLFERAASFPWDPAPDPDGPPRDPLLGRVMGSFRLVEVIGRGGSATVYRGERADDVFHQTVAVKVVDPNVMGRSLRSRFRQEQEILAGLEHPNIAHLLDGGITDDGWPYIVMELVEGEPIDRYCDDRRFTLEDRLRLFLPVCGAVQWAHNNLVVHRDLKPGNVLVTGDGVPKLLDFGIAKLLRSPALEGDSVETLPGLTPMTPAYAAPEQIGGGGVTTATDVYQLGELLHLLLTGHRPFEDAPGWSALLARVENDSPRPPSTWATRPASPASPVSGGEGETTDPAERRHTTAPKLARALAGDLDTLVLTALQRDPGRRYPSPGALAADIERYLKGQPLLAHPDTLGYRTRKLLARHPVAAAATALAVGAVVVLGTRLAQEYHRAEMETAKAAAVTGFMVGLFEQPDPEAAATDTLTARALLDAGAERIRHELEDQPVTQAAVMSAVGRAYLGLGRVAEAGQLFEGAAERRRALLPEDHPDVVAGLTDLGDLRLEEGEAEAARELFDDAVHRSRRVHGWNSRPTADALTGLALALQIRGDVDGALARSEEALGIYRATGPLDEKATDLLVNLGWLYQRLEDLPRAEALFREVLALRRAHLGEDHATVGTALAALAAVERRAGRTDSALVHSTRALEIAESIHGPDNTRVVGSLIARGATLLQAGRPEEAEGDYRRALDLLVAQRGEDTPTAARVANDLGNLVRDLGRLDESEELLRSAVRGYGAVHGEAHLFTGIALHNLATTLGAAERWDEAAESLGRAVAIFEAEASESSPRVGRSLTLLGGIEIGRGDPEAAEVVLRRALGIWESADPPDPVQLANTRAQLGRSLHLQGRHAEAEPFLLAAHAAMREIASDTHPATRRAAEWLAELYEALDRAPEAARYRSLATG